MTSRINPADFPRLSEFARGYLHQDFMLEHGSAPQAAKAYLLDLHTTERKQVAAEAVRLLSLVEHWTSAEAAAAIVSLGAAWKPNSVDSLSRVLQALAVH